MNAERAFLDTNILIYLYCGDDDSKKETVIRTINLFERYVSTQVLSEFCNVCIRKLKLPTFSVKQAGSEITDICNIILIDDKTI